MTNDLSAIENLVRETLAHPRVGDLGIAHNFDHVDRVRHWALRIAAAESYPDLTLVGAAALLHDIGLAYVVDRSQHGSVGAEIAGSFLRELGCFADNQIVEVETAIRAHNAPPQPPPSPGAPDLTTILRDADTLDLLGAVGLMRGIASRHVLPLFPPQRVRGELWGISGEELTQRRQAGLPTATTITDQINFQIACYDNLRTATARQIGAPLVAWMRVFLIQLEREVDDRTQEGLL